MATISDKTRELISFLSQKTENNEIQWEKSSGTDSYQLILKKGSIAVDNYYNENYSQNFMDFTMFNDMGEPIEQTSAGYSDDNYSYNYLKEFHSIIKRKYLKVDETIESFFQELGKKSDLPF